MVFLLDSQNITIYLKEQGICSDEELRTYQATLKTAKNFNLLVELPRRSLLVKQERHTLEGTAAKEFLKEWQVQELFQSFSEFKALRLFLPEMLSFDSNNSILIFNYLKDYQDLASFYSTDQSFPAAIASTLGAILAALHRISFNNQAHQAFLAPDGQNRFHQPLEPPTANLDRIGPEVFGSVPADGLKFFALYQRYDSLGKAIAELTASMRPCCLTHNDLKLNNILLHQDWAAQISESEPEREAVIRLIDWERCGWGDPAFDLGMLVASYLQIWLGSLVVSRSIDIQEALRLAVTPLEALQPSLAALVKSYLQNFPAIFQARPDFLKRVIQCAGLALIQQIQAMIQYEKSFGNTGICMLQVAKSLLCRPEQAMPTVFGSHLSEILHSFA